eukprot:scaffold10.g2319.t1
MDVARRTLRSLRHVDGTGSVAASDLDESLMGSPLPSTARASRDLEAPTWEESARREEGGGGGGGGSAAEEAQRAAWHASLTGPRSGRALWSSARFNLGEAPARAFHPAHRRPAGPRRGRAPPTAPLAPTAAPAPGRPRLQGCRQARPRGGGGAGRARRRRLLVLAGPKRLGGFGTGGGLPRDVGAEGPGVYAPLSDAKKLFSMVASSWLNLLLLCIPAGITAGVLRASPTLVFVLVGWSRAVRFGQTIGGLLNATFGNVVELILSIAALEKGLYTVVATSLIGSILSNLLLVASSLLFLSCIAIIIPSTATLIYGRQVMTDGVVVNLSHAIAVVLVLTYLCYLLFQLKTHADLFHEGESEEAPALSLSGAIAMLGCITVVVAICSEYLTGAIEAAFLGLIVLPIAGNACEHITAVFVAVKARLCLWAMRCDKMDLSIGVALGSSIQARVGARGARGPRSPRASRPPRRSLGRAPPARPPREPSPLRPPPPRPRSPPQIALFVVPSTVLVGWATGKDFTLNFDAFSVLMLTVSVILAYFVSSDGSSNWILGLQLCVTYLLIAFVFLLEKEPKEAGPGGAAAAAAASGAPLGRGSFGAPFVLGT